jgi:hypothetical protein
LTTRIVRGSSGERTEIFQESKNFLLRPGAFTRSPVSAPPAASDAGAANADGPAAPRIPDHELLGEFEQAMAAVRRGEMEPARAALQCLKEQDP